MATRRVVNPMPPAKAGQAKAKATRDGAGKGQRSARRSTPRAKAKAAPAKQAGPDRAQEIYELMAAGVWVRGVSERELALQWGLSMQAVSKFAATASARIQQAFSPDDLSAVRAHLLAVSESSLSRSVRAGREREVLAAIDAMSKLTGLYPWAERSAGSPQRGAVEIHVHGPSAPPSDERTDEAGPAVQPPSVGDPPTTG